MLAGSYGGLAASHRHMLVASHGFLCAVMLVWAWVLVQPIPTFPSSLAFQWFDVTWPESEPGWAAIFAILGLIGVGGMFVKVRMLRLLSIVLVSTGHGMISWATFEAYHNSPYIVPAPYVYALIAIAGYGRVWLEP